MKTYLEPILELVVFGTILVYSLIIAQVINKGCHGIDAEVITLFTICGGISYFILRNINLNKKENKNNDK